MIQENNLNILIMCHHPYHDLIEYNNKYKETINYDVWFIDQRISGSDLYLYQIENEQTKLIYQNKEQKKEFILNSRFKLYDNWDNIINKFNFFVEIRCPSNIFYLNEYVNKKQFPKNIYQCSQNKYLQNEVELKKYSNLLKNENQQIINEYDNKEFKIEWNEQQKELDILKLNLNSNELQLNDKDKQLIEIMKQISVLNNERTEIQLNIQESQKLLRSQSFETNFKLLEINPEINFRLKPSLDFIEDSNLYINTINKQIQSINNNSINELFEQYSITMKTYFELKKIYETIRNNDKILTQKIYKIQSDIELLKKLIWQIQNDFFILKQKIRNDEFVRREQNKQLKIEKLLPIQILYDECVIIKNSYNFYDIHKCSYQIWHDNWIHYIYLSDNTLKEINSDIFQFNLINIFDESAANCTSVNWVHENNKFLFGYISFGIWKNSILDCIYDKFDIEDYYKNTN